MHDETFLVTQGSLRFHGKDGAIIDAHTGDYVTVPPRAPHTFVSFLAPPALFLSLRQAISPFPSPPFLPTKRTRPLFFLAFPCHKITQNPGQIRLPQSKRYILKLGKYLVE